MLKLKFQSFGHLMGRVLWKRPRSWEKLKAGGEGEDRTWDGWMASLTQCTWVWANSGRSWRTGKPGVLQSMGSQRVRHNWVTEQQQKAQRNLKTCPWSHNTWTYTVCLQIPVAQMVKNLSAIRTRKTWVRIPGSGRSPGEGNGYPLQYSCLENSTDSPWGCKESDTTERLTHFANVLFIQNCSFSVLLPSKTVFIIPEVAHQ